MLPSELCLIKHAEKIPRICLDVQKFLKERIKYSKVSPSRGKSFSRSFNLYVSLALFFALCSYMGGAEVPVDWKGALNLTYRYGGSLINSARYVRFTRFTRRRWPGVEFSDFYKWYKHTEFIAYSRVRIRISTKNEKKRTYNVFGVIRGRVEPGWY